MKCPFCGHEFDEKEAGSCKGCLLAKSCNKVKCPNCGYDLPSEPKEIRLFKAWRRSRGTGREG